MAIQRLTILLSILQEMKELQEDFASCLHFASAEEPLFIFLDSLDQFGPEDNARQLAWLPTVLPSNVKLVVSTLPNSEYECFPILQVRKEFVSYWNFNIFSSKRAQIQTWKKISILFCKINSSTNQNTATALQFSPPKDSPGVRFICWSLTLGINVSLQDIEDEQVGLVLLYSRKKSCSDIIRVEEQMDILTVQPRMAAAIHLSSWLVSVLKVACIFFVFLFL